MTQADRDRLVTLKKAKKKLITQAEAAAELQVSERHVKRMLKNLAQHGDKSVMHGLRGQESNRKIDVKVRQKAVKILSAEVYRGFGPTLAGEHLAKKHGIEVEPGDAAEVDAGGGSVERQAATGGERAYVAAAAQPVRRTGAVGHQRS